jgi:hypothetical protein
MGLEEFDEAGDLQEIFLADHLFAVCFGCAEPRGGEGLLGAAMAVGDRDGDGLQAVRRELREYALLSLFGLKSIFHFTLYAATNRLAGATKRVAERGNLGRSVWLEGGLRVAEPQIVWLRRGILDFGFWILDLYVAGCERDTFRRAGRNGCQQGWGCAPGRFLQWKLANYSHGGGRR